MKLEFDVKFNDKKIKSAMMREAEKAAAKKISAQRPIVSQKPTAVCKHCKTKFFAPIESGICPHCRKPMN